MAKIFDALLNKEYELRIGKSYIIGRDKELSDIVIPPMARTVSRIHGLIKFFETWRYFDLKSDNGTKINGTSWTYANGSADIKNNDMIELASDSNMPYKLIFKDERKE